MADKNRFYMSTHDITPNTAKDPKAASSKVLLKAKQREENARQFVRQNSQSKIATKVGLTKSIIKNGEGHKSGKRLVRDDQYHKV